MYNEYEWAVYNKDRLSKTEVGKFILCEAREDNVTRLFVHQFSTIISAFTKRGWWDTFTISKQLCNKGFYICCIQEFKIDRNGYLNCIVYPSKYLGTRVDEDSIAWEYLFRTGNFSKEYTTQKHSYRFNIKNLNNVFQQKFEDSGYSNMESFIFSEFIDNNISLDEIANALNELYDDEKLVIKLSEDMNNNNTQEYINNYPLLVKKLPKDNIWKCYTPKCTWDYLNNNDMTYSWLRLGKETDLLKRVESVLQYYDDIHKKEKEERKKKKLEMKALKNQ